MNKDTIYRQDAIDALIAEGRNVDSRYLESERIIHESDAVEAISMLPSARPEPCELCSNLEKGDTLYQSSDWDGGIGFDYIWDIRFCPKCGRSLE